MAAIPAPPAVANEAINAVLPTVAPVLGGAPPVTPDILAQFNKRKRAVEALHAAGATSDHDLGQQLKHQHLLTRHSG